tara:strand:- start:221 stop:427 length:207 start_codon:yes stop_codon:yes gene_type:complete
MNATVVVISGKGCILSVNGDTWWNHGRILASMKKEKSLSVWRGNGLEQAMPAAMKNDVREEIGFRLNS